jgi:surface protein
MQLMFNDADAFNQPLENWDVSNVHYMPYMFKSADSFNQPLGNWNTSNVSDMRQMFLNASSFNQSLGNWDIGNLSMISQMLNFCGMDCGNYSATLAGWSTNANVPQGLALGASTMQYGSNVQNQRNYLTLTKGWSISGDMATNTICCFPDYHPITDTACQFYTYNGQTYVQSGVYHDTLLNALGCDSIIVLNLNILHPDVTVSQAGPVLTANAAGVAYQWIRWPSNSPVTGQTNQTFTANTNGSYAVIITDNGCVDTSNCITVSDVGAADINNDANSLTIFPNPVSNTLSIQLSGSWKYNTDIRKEVYNSTGQLIFTTHKNELNVTGYPKGLYYLKCAQHTLTFIVQ